MCFCLFFLTGVNFIVFPQQNISQKAALPKQDKGDDKDPSAPVEEKSSANNSLSVQEEYIHELHSLDEFSETKKLLHYKNTAVEKLQTVHFELLSPPPEA